jgi:predicted NAD/FAD-binding protein
VRKLKIAVIGSGISGLATSWKLSKSCDVELYEKNNYFGGHANTQTVKLRDEKQFYVDTGFIVFNEINYPNLCHLFRNLGVETYSSDMSFAASINDGNVEYSGSSLLNMFAQKKNIFNPKFLKMIYEIIKFYRTVEKDAKIYTEHTLKDYLEEKS